MQICKLGHLQMVCYSFKFFKSVNVRICRLRNLFAGCPPLLHSQGLLLGEQLSTPAAVIPHLYSTIGEVIIAYGELGQNYSSPLLSVSGHNHLPCVTRLTRNTFRAFLSGRWSNWKKSRLVCHWKDLFTRFFISPNQIKTLNYCYLTKYGICRNYSISSCTLSAIFMIW